MANYFKKFPKIYYNGKIVTDVIARTVINSKYNDANKLSVFYPYDMQEGDTPDIIAFKYYGDAEKHWLVLLANEIMDPFFDFSLTYSQFETHLQSKYKNHANSLNIWETGSWKEDWVSNYSYSVNDIVKYGNYAYNCSNNHISSDFSSDLISNKWSKILDGTSWKSTWQTGVEYVEQDVVSYNSTLYVCKQDNTSSSVITVSNADYWKTYNNAIEFCKVSINPEPFSYRTVRTVTDISSGQIQIEEIWIDKKTFLDQYENETINYTTVLTPVKPQDEIDPDVEYTQVKEVIHIYDYEQEVNENKRQIKLIRKEFAGQIEKELKYLMEAYYG